MRLLKDAGLQRAAQRAQPDEPGDARRVRPPRRARHGRADRHLDPIQDLVRRVGDVRRPLAERHRGARGQGLQPPERRALLDRQRDPRARAPRSARPGAAGSPRASARSTTPGSSRTASTASSPTSTRWRRRWRSEAAQDPSDPNTMMADMGEQMALMNASSLVTESTEESAAVLDVVGFNYADSRYELDAELFPHRVIVGSETFPAKIDVMWDLVDPAAARHRRLHLDRLGLPRRGRHRPRRLHGCRGLRVDRHRRPVPVPARRVRRHRHHRPPPHDLVLPRDRVRAAHRPVHRGAPPAAPRPADGDDPVVVGRRDRRHGRGMSRPAHP